MWGSYSICFSALLPLGHLGRRPVVLVSERPAFLHHLRAGAFCTPKGNLVLRFNARPFFVLAWLAVRFKI
jgi:hypothetical protein